VAVVTDITIDDRQVVTIVGDPYELPLTTQLLTVNVPPKLAIPTAELPLRNCASRRRHRGLLCRISKEPRRY
jgi:hypothetical protein